MGCPARARSEAAAAGWPCACRRNRSPRSHPAQMERAVEVVCVRARGDVEHGVGALPVELGVGPIRPLAARVLGQVDLVRALQKSLRRPARVEVDLGHLPVALVLVGVVERVVEPVLDRELAGVRRVGGEVGVDAGPGRCRRWWDGTPRRTRTASAAFAPRAPASTSRPAAAMPIAGPEPKRAP